MTEEIYRLPRDYRSRLDPEPYLDMPGGVVFQPHVYELALFVAERANVEHIIDIGCGAATKLQAVQHNFEIICVDTPAGIELAKSCLCRAEFIETDLENGLSELPDNMFDNAVVICADVIEHLRDPFPLALRLAEIESRCKFLFISTPDRDRARGLMHLGPPTNTAHVREWTAGEFGVFLKDAGFCDGLLIGHTINNDVNLLKATTLVIAGRDSHPRCPVPRKSVAAIIHAYNEDDIIEETIRHLYRQGIEIHVFDNWSTDNTYNTVEKLVANGQCASVRRFPDRATNQYQWVRQLAETERFAATLQSDWVMHYDADEFRYSPWRGVSLADAISFIDSLGYNALDFSVIDFRFLEKRSSATKAFEAALTHFEFATRPGGFVQIKGWKNNGSPIQLAQSGGHEAKFENRRIFPLKFLLKHYPLRNREQAHRKIFCDRAPRFEAERRARGWHTHYDKLIDLGEISGWNAYDLIAWQPHFFDSEFIVERLSGIGVPIRKPPKASDISSK